MVCSRLSSSVNLKNILILPGRILRWLVLQESVDLRHDIRCEFGQQFQTLHVIDDLFRSRGPRNYRGDVLVFQAPCQRELRQFDSELVRQFLCIRVNFLVLHSIVGLSHTFKPTIFLIVPAHCSFSQSFRTELANLSLLSANLEPAGGSAVASLYLPLKSPIFRGEKVVNPIPYREYSR